MGQQFRVTTTTALDNLDGDVIGSGVDYEGPFWHDIPLGPSDFSTLGELIESDKDDDGRYLTMLFERFDTDSDRGESFGVIVTSLVEYERMAETEARYGLRDSEGRYYDA